MFCRCVPNLRFPLFFKEWTKSKLKNICSINPKNNYLIPDSFLYVDLESVKNGTLTKEQIIDKSNAPSRAQRCLEYDDILYSCVRPYQHNNYLFRQRNHAIASTGFAVLRNQPSSVFLYCLIDSKQFENKVLNRCTGTSYPAINTSDLGNIEIFYPEKNEQEKIGHFINLFNRRIEIQNKIINNFEKLEKAIRKLCCAKSNFFVESIGDVFTVSKEKLKTGKESRVYTASAKNGLIDEEEFFKKKVSGANKSNYQVIRNGDYVFSKSASKDAPYGALIRFNGTLGLVSPLYWVLRPQKNINEDLIRIWFSSSFAARQFESKCQEGARNHGMLNISLEDFLSIKIWASLPKQIIECTHLLKTKIEQSKIEMSLYQKEKAFFLRSMFI